MIRIIQSGLISCHGNLITRFLTTLLKLNVNRFIRTLRHIKRNAFQLLLFIIGSQNHFPNSFTLICLHSSQFIRKPFLIHIKKGIRIDLLQLFLSRIADIHFIISHHVAPLCFPVKPSGGLGGLQHKLLALQLDDTVLPSFQTTDKLMTAVRKGIKKKEINTPEDLKPFLQKQIVEILTAGEDTTRIAEQGPTVLLVIGVNGAGKTTTIGKLAAYYKGQGKSVLLAAADTFRAAAIDQLEVWGQRTGVPVIKHEEGSDPAAVAFDAVKAAVARKVDMLIIDTAGRLQTKSNLMQELEKINRVIGREIPGAPHETLLVLDATTGQNAISQAELFTKAAPITGVVLTKLDGTAKGGVVIGIKSQLSMPVKWIGVGEGVEDLRPFNAEDFAKALFGE